MHCALYTEGVLKVKYSVNSDLLDVKLLYCLLFRVSLSALYLYNGNKNVIPLHSVVTLIQLLFVKYSNVAAMNTKEYLR